MTADFSENESANSHELEVVEREQLQQIEVEEETLVHEYRSNPFGVLEEDKERTRFGVFFLYGEEKKSIQKKWNLICDMDDVEQAQMVTNLEGTISINSSDINPDYFKYCIGLNPECEQMYKKDGMPVRAHVYAVDGIDKVALCMFRRTENSQYEGWNRGEWTFYAEERGIVGAAASAVLLERLLKLLSGATKIKFVLPWDYMWIGLCCVVVVSMVVALYSTRNVANDFKRN